MSFIERRCAIDTGKSRSKVLSLVQCSKNGKRDCRRHEKKTHICIECLTEMTSKAKRTPNDWHAALCNAKSSSNVWLHLQRKHRYTTKDAGLMKEFEKKDAKKRKAFSTTTKNSTQTKIAIGTTTCGSDGEIIIKKQRSSFHHGKLQFVTNETVSNSLSTFLIRSGVAFNAIDNEDFKTFYRLCRSDTNAPTLGRSVHNSNIDSCYDDLKGLVVQAVSNEIRTMFPV